MWEMYGAADDHANWTILQWATWVILSVSSLHRGGSRGRVQGVRTPPPWEKTMWFIGVEAEQETSAPPPKKNPGSAPVTGDILSAMK